MGFFPFFFLGLAFRMNPKDGNFLVCSFRLFLGTFDSFVSLTFSTNSTIISMISSVSSWPPLFGELCNAQCFPFSFSP